MPKQDEGPKIRTSLTLLSKGSSGRKVNDDATVKAYHPTITIGDLKVAINDSQRTLKKGSSRLLKGPSGIGYSSQGSIASLWHYEGDTERSKQHHFRKADSACS